MNFNPLMKVLVFELSLFTVKDNVCVPAWLSPVSAQLAKGMLGPLLAAEYILILEARNAMQKCHSKNIWLNGPFENKVFNATILALILGYQPLTISALTLLQCVQIKKKQVLFTFPDVPCFQVWQYLVITFVVLWVLTFPCIVAVKKESLRTMSERVKVIMFPFLFLGTSLQTMKGLCVPPIKDRERVSKDQAETHERPRSRTGIILLRRLACSSVFVFTFNPLLRMLLLVFILLVSTTHLLVLRPYKHLYLTWIELSSLIALFLIAVGNCIASVFEAPNHHSQGSDQILKTSFTVFENLFSKWATLISVVLVVL